MANESALVHLNRNGSLKKYGGVEMQEDYNLLLSPDYLSATVPFYYAERLSGKIAEGESKEVTQVKANQFVAIYPACTVSPKRYRLLVEPNPELFKYGSVNCPSIIESWDATQPVVYLTAHKSIDLEELPWLIKILLLD